MPENINLTIACDPYEQIRPLKEGAVNIDNCNVRFVDLKPGEMTKRAFEDSQFGVTELSISQYITRRIAGNCDFTIMPIFFHRVFTHGMLYVRPGGDIRAPQDLRGRRVGITGYTSSANTWLRGMLNDDFNVKATEVTWVNVVQDATGHPGAKAPPGIKVDQVIARSLAEALDRGDIDAVGVSRPQTGSGITRMFPDYTEREDASYRHSGVYPTNHIMAIRTSLAERHPWLPGAVFRAFQESKKRAYAAEVATPKLARMRGLIGDDYLPFGLNDTNRKTMEAFVRYHFDQGLAPRRYGFDELFAPVPLTQYEV